MLLSPFYRYGNREASGSPVLGKPGFPGRNERSHLFEAIRLLKGTASLGLSSQRLKSKPFPFGAATCWALGSETPPTHTHNFPRF